MDPEADHPDVFPHLKPPPEMVIYNQVKVPLSEADVRSMAEARVLYTTPGFEAFSTSSLKLMAKGVSAFANLEVMKLLQPCTACIRCGGCWSDCLANRKRVTARTSTTFRSSSTFPRRSASSPSSFTATAPTGANRRDTACGSSLTTTTG